MAITILCNVFERAHYQNAICTALKACQQHCFDCDDGIEYARKKEMKILLEGGSDV